MNSDYTVRNLTSNDAEVWASLRHEAVEKHPFAFGASLPDNPAMLIERFNRIITSRTDEVVIGTFAGETLVGVAGVRRHEAEKQRHKAELWGMYVTPSHRGSGGGQLLLRAAIEHARTWHGITHVHLSVSEVATEAKRLYEKAGFREWGREPQALCWQGRCVDSSHMVLQL